MRTVLPFRGLRRRSILTVLVVVLMLSLLPTAAFASSGGRYGRPDYSQPRAQAYHRQAPRYDNNYSYNYTPRQTHRYSYCDTTYRVRRGDTLSEIARHYRVSIRELANANRLRNPNRIYAGTTLCIPD